MGIFSDNVVLENLVQFGWSYVPIKGYFAISEKLIRQKVVIPKKSAPIIAAGITVFGDAIFDVPSHGLYDGTVGDFGELMGYWLALDDGLVGRGYRFLKDVAYKLGRGQSNSSPTQEVGSDVIPSTQSVET